VGRDGDGAAEHGLEGGHDPLVVGRGTLVEDPPPHGPALHDLVQVVVDDGVAEPRHEIVDSLARRLVGDQVGLHEDGAALPHPQRPSRRQGSPTELPLDADPQLLGLLLEKGPRAGGADLVHHEIDDGAVLEGDELRVLATDLEDGIDLGVDGRRRRGLGSDLVAHDVGADEIGTQVASAARRAGPEDRQPVADLLPHPPQTLLDGLERLPRGHQVLLGQHVLRLVDHDDVGRDAAHVHPQIAAERSMARHESDGGPLLAVTVAEPQGWQALGLAAARRLLPERPESWHGADDSTIQEVERRPEGGDTSEVLRDDQPALRQPHDLPEGPLHSGVRGHTSDQADRRLQGLALGDVRPEVAHHGEAETRDDVTDRGGLLLEVDHVGLREDRAAAGQARGTLAVESGPRELLDAQTQPVGLLVQERARSGRAQGVHREVVDLQPTVGPPGDEDHLGVLTSHVDDGPRCRVKVADAADRSDDLVDLHGLEQRAEARPAAAGDRAGTEVLSWKALEYAAEDLLGHGQRPAFRAGVVGKEPPRLGVQHHGVDADRAQVQTQEQPFAVLLGPPWLAHWRTSACRVRVPCPGANRRGDGRVV